MRMRKSARAKLLALLVPATLCWSEHSAAAKPARGPELPEIRVSAANSVPQCVTPDRLMRYLADRNPRLDARYRDIAALYQQHGEALGIRWDYAFFQMVLETNSLLFTGDVKAKQNNFAGLGATGGGVPGESFANVSTGVLAQLQHLVAYSGQKVEAPVAAAHARESEGHHRQVADAAPAGALLGPHQPLGGRPQLRPVDERPGHRASTRPTAHRSISSRTRPGPGAARSSRWRPLRRRPPRSPKAAREEGRRGCEKKPEAPAETATLACDIWQASYGGTAALLIRSVAGARVNYTVLQVAAGKEQPQADAYMKEHARNGETIGRFGSRDEAMTRAFELCPGPS